MANAALKRIYEETIGELFQPASIFPVQFEEIWSRNAEFMRGEKALMFAVLEEGIKTYLDQNCHSNRESYNPERRLAIQREAEAWIWKDDWISPFSFLNICAELGIDASFLRKGLRQLKKRIESKKNELLEQGKSLPRRIVPMPYNRNPSGFMRSIHA